MSTGIRMRHCRRRGVGHQLSFKVMKDDQFDVGIMNMTVNVWIHGKIWVIRKIIVHNLHKDGINWKSVPAPHKEAYFEAFKNHFEWFPPAYRAAFMWEAARCYDDILFKFKKESGSGFRKPTCVPQDLWEKLLAHSSPRMISRL